MATSLALVGVSRLKLNSSLSALLPDDYISVITLNKIKEKVGGFETLQILIEGDDFEAIKRYASDLAPVLADNEMVLVVDYQRDVDFFEKNALLYVKTDELRDIRNRIRKRIKRERRKRNPLYLDLAGEFDAPPEEEGLSFEDYEQKYSATDDKRFYVNSDQSILVLNVYPDGANTNVAFARKFIKEIRRIVAETDPKSYDPSLTVKYGGNTKNKIDEYEVIISDVKSSALVSIMLVLAVIVIYFRTPLVVVIIGVPLAMSICWTFGLTWLLIGSLNTMTVFLFIVLFGLGIDFGIHLYARYRESRAQGLDAKTAASDSMDLIARAFVTAGLTTSTAFLSLTLADFKGFYEFGLIAGVGVLFSLLSMTAVMPTFLMMFDKLMPNRDLSKATILPTAGTARTSWTKWALFAGIAAAVVGTVTLPRIEFEYDFTNLRSQIPESMEVKKKLKTIFKESNSPAVVLVESDEELLEVQAFVEEKIASDTTPTIDKFKSIYTALPSDQETKLGLIADIRELLSDKRLQRVTGEERSQIDRLMELTDVQALTVEDLPEKVLRIFRGKSGETGTFAYILPGVPLKDGRNSILFAEDVRTMEAPSGKTYHASNSNVIIADMLLMIQREGPRAVMITIIAVLLLVILDLRSIRSGLLVMSPLIMGVLWLFIVMYVRDMKFNFYNIVVIPSIIGIGIDNGVHLFHRFRQEGTSRTGYILRTTGGAVAASSLTTMVGFAGLLTAHHPGLRAIGELAVIGILSTLIAAVGVLPGLFDRFGQSDHN